MDRKLNQILIVEDEALIAFDLADLLEDAGYTIHGPYADADEALNALKSAELTLAILDVNLGEGRTSEKVAEYLTRTGTPIVFVSGYTPAGSEVLRNYPNAQRLSKPWDPQELLAMVDRFVRKGEGTEMPAPN
ncbi:response regulator [Acuticoccus sp. M5D2P5]|uniref:response regulator n=1 Tax=Acuticoccus kalidii TaxID=2910977 RepID=UPI001F29D484|nr:response regulator [Acuticoccus kalidii]MCF3933684.1 response regulator [Acuticoccus kalidii]